MRILTRYVLLELIKVFLVALGGLTGLMIVVGVVREACMQHLPMGEVLRLIPYILPDALRVALPVTLLLAASYVYGRMSGANELVAAKSLGISPMVFLWPVLGLAVVLSLLTVWLNDLAVSWGRNGAQRVIVGSVEKIVYSVLRARHSYASPKLSISVKRVEGRRLIRPTLTLAAEGSTPNVTITADDAELHADHSQGVLKIVLRNVTVDAEGKMKAQLPDYEAEIPLPDASRSRDHSSLPSWLPLRAIPEELARQRALVDWQEQELAARAAHRLICGDVDALATDQWQRSLTQLAYARERISRLLTEPHRRWSAGFSCLCFVWVGAPMAIWLRNRDFLTSFFLCFLPVLVVYYPLLALGVDGAKSGTLPPYAVWAGNLLMLLAGTWWLRKVLRY